MDHFRQIRTQSRTRHSTPSQLSCWGFFFSDCTLSFSFSSSSSSQFRLSSINSVYTYTGIVCHPRLRRSIQQTARASGKIKRKTYPVSIVCLGHHTLPLSFCVQDKWEQIECRPANLYLFIFRPYYILLLLLLLSSQPERKTRRIYKRNIKGPNLLSCQISPLDLDI